MFHISYVISYQLLNVGGAGLSYFLFQLPLRGKLCIIPLFQEPDMTQIEFFFVHRHFQYVLSLEHPQNI